MTENAVHDQEPSAVEPASDAALPRGRQRVGKANDQGAIDAPPASVR